MSNMNWIKVEDRLPEIEPDEFYSDDVICWVTSHGEPFNSMPNTYEKDKKYHSIDCLIKWNDGSVCFRSDKFYGKVTHWMNLPNEPED